MRNLENIDLDTLDHVTGGCGGGQQAAQQTPAAEQHHGNATTLVGFPVQADTSTKTMSDYGVPSLSSFTEYAPPADSDDTATVQSDTDDGDDDGSSHQAGQGRFGGGFGHHAAAADDDATAAADDTTSTTSAQHGAWDEATAAISYPVYGDDDSSTSTTAATDDDDGGYLTPMHQADTGFAHADAQSQAATTEGHTGAMVCGVMSGDGTDDADGAAEAVEAGVGAHDTGLGSFHTVDRSATTSMMYGGEFEAADADTSQAQYALSGDLGGHGDFQVANGDVNVDVDTAAGGLHLGYNGGQLSASLNRDS